MTRDNQLPCPCKSGLSAFKCCNEGLAAIGLQVGDDQEGTYLLNWAERFSSPISKTFDEKTRTFAYRISRYLDAVLDTYQHLEYPSGIEVAANTNEIYWHQKHSVALTFAAAYRLLSEGLFVQSGVLLRTAIESSLVLLEIARDPHCIDQIQSNKYKSHSVMSRVKTLVPAMVVNWYGYFSANFTHVAAIHQAPYLPRSCYPDNWIIITGLQNILRAVVAHHCLLERAYIDENIRLWFWKRNNRYIEFDSNSPIFKWAENLGRQLNQSLPIDEKISGAYSTRPVTLKS